MKPHGRVGDGGVSGSVVDVTEAAGRPEIGCGRSANVRKPSGRTEDFGPPRGAGRPNERPNARTLTHGRDDLLHHEIVGDNPDLP